MNRLALLAIAILVLPAASASTELIGSSMRIVADIDIDDIEVITNLRPESPCDEPDIVRQPQYGSFRFSETYQEVACAEVQLHLEVPNATRADIRFAMDRKIGQAQEQFTLSPSMVQDLVVRDADGAGLGRFSVFEQDEGSSVTAREFQQTVSTVGREGIIIGWHIEDAGSQASGRSVTKAQSVASQVRDIAVAFEGIDISVMRTRSVPQVADEHLIVNDQWAVRVPLDAYGSGKPEVSFQFDSLVDILAVNGPAGAIAPDQLDVRIASGGETVVIPTDVMAAHGPGLYQLSTISRQAVVADAALAPIAGTGLFLPILGAGYASYQYNQAQQRAREANRKSNPAILSSLVGIGVLYVMVLIFLITSGEFWNLLISPMPVAGMGYFLLLVGIAVAFVAVAIVGVRKQEVAIQQEVDDLMATKAKLERSNHDLEYFAYIASHDLQEPLRTISGFSQLLERRYGDQLPEGGKRYLEKTIAGSQRMQQLIGDLLAFSRITTHTEIQDSVDVGDVVDREIDQIRALVRETGAKIERSALPTLPGDPNQLGQVFSNLLRNAIRYAHPDRTPEIKITATLDGRWWNIDVADNGMGIPEEQFERIFIIFQRLAPRSDNGGTGIGLSIVQRIVERHNGRVTLDSKVGEGTTFHLRLPAGVQQ